MSTLTDSIVAFCRLFAVYEREAICCGTVTVPQCVVLQTLRHGDWDVSALATSTRVTNGAMTRLLDGLENKGFIERARGQDDRRRVEVHLTKVGRKEANRLAELTQAAVDAILERVPRAKRKQVVESVALLLSAAQDVRDQLECC